MVLLSQRIGLLGAKCFALGAVGRMYGLLACFCFEGFCYHDGLWSRRTKDEDEDVDEDVDEDEGMGTSDCDAHYQR